MMTLDLFEQSLISVYIFTRDEYRNGYHEYSNKNQCSDKPFLKFFRNHYNLLATYSDIIIFFLFKFPSDRPLRRFFIIQSGSSGRTLLIRAKIPAAVATAVGTVQIIDKSVPETTEEPFLHS